MQSYTLFERVKEPQSGHWYTRKIGKDFYSLEKCALAIFQDCKLVFRDAFTIELRCTELAQFFKFEYCGTINGKIYIVEEQNKTVNEAYEEFVATIRNYPQSALKEALEQMEAHPQNFDTRYITCIKKYIDGQPKVFTLSL